MNFLMENWGMKKEKKLFFYKLNINDEKVLLHRDIDDNNNKNIYMLIYKRKFKKMSKPF